MRPMITVHPDRKSNTWLATFHDNSEVERLFGSDTLPTAYTLLTAGETVRRAVERKNPGFRVRLVELGGKLYDPETADDHDEMGERHV